MSGAAVSADLGSSSNYSGETPCLYLAGGPTSMLDKELES